MELLISTRNAPDSDITHRQKYLAICYLFTTRSQVWELWKEGSCDDIVDESMGDSCSKEEALRCIQIGLLCVQEFTDDRPNMSAVVFMLANSDVVLASPKRPAYVFQSKQHGGNLSTSSGTTSANHVTISMVEGR